MTEPDMKVMCPERRCGWHGLRSELLRAPHPFEPSIECTGCPRCKTIDAALVACESADCWEESTCGTPTKGGYLRTCMRHQP